MHAARFVRAARHLIHMGLAVVVLEYVAFSVVDAQMRPAAMQRAATAMPSSSSAGVLRRHYDSSAHAAPLIRAAVAATQ